ncbi:hypothetical protein [Gemmatimonas sp.]|uniref:hypothetical protein n=1 Tax=Gemmatimonas sp. TaxID=1962908 RepID=UPI003983BD69
MANSNADHPDRTAKPTPHAWVFRTRFRRNCFGWKSQPAIARVKEAVAEIRKVAKRDRRLAADGAVLFLEKVSPALEQVDSSSGSIGTAVNNAIAALVPIIAGAEVDAGVRAAWLERLFEALQADEIPYIESLGDHWGDLCASPAVASEWADRLIDITRRVLSPDRQPGTYFKGTTACLSALHRAGRHDELIEIVRAEKMWTYRQWAVKAMLASGRSAEALRYAEASRNPWSSDQAIDATCEEILLRSGMRNEAYTRYGMFANGMTSHLATFRAVTKKYPERPPHDVLMDLVIASPGQEGKWFAAAKDAGFLTEAVALARQSPCDPRTLTRASRDYAAQQPAFALEVGLLALHWLVQGAGYEITSTDVIDAFRATVHAAQVAGRVDEVVALVQGVVDAGGPRAEFVATAVRSVRV